MLTPQSSVIFSTKLSSSRFWGFFIGCAHQNGWITKAEINANIYYT